MSVNTTRTGRKFIVTVDNYFSLPKVMKKLRYLGIGCLGTARVRQGWPLDELQEQSINSRYKNDTFNHLYWTVDESGTLVSRWMDNKFVIIVSTIHNGLDTIVSLRRRPKVIRENKRHIDCVWGTAGT